MRVVRTSKFRHVYGAPFRREDCYENIPISRSAWDSNFCDVNEKFIACILEVAGGGAFAVLTHKQTGKLNEIPRVTGHKGPVLDVAWNPFNSNMIASGSDDCTAKIWIIPNEGLDGDLIEPALSLEKHGRRVGQVCWHPTANDMLFTSSADLTIKGWNIGTGEDVITIAHHPDTIFWFSFDAKGTQLATTCKDKKLRVFDPLRGTLLCEADGPQGAKPSRCVFLGDSKRIISTGFSKQHERQYILYQAEDLSQLTQEVLDTSSGTLMPFYDADLKILYLAGKGDGNIRYFEVVDDKPYIHYLSQYSSTDPQRGIGYLPKRAVDVTKCEIARMYKLHPRNAIEPISFIVPRKSDNFQEDIFPDTQGDVPSLTADEWLAGKVADPVLISLRDGYVPTKVEFVAPVIQAAPVEKAPQTSQEYELAYSRLQSQVARLTDELASKDKRVQELENELKELKQQQADAANSAALAAEPIIAEKATDTEGSDEQADVFRDPVVDDEKAL